MWQLKAEVQRLEDQLAEADRLLLTIENSLLFRLARQLGRRVREWRGRLGQLLLHSPFHPFYTRLATSGGDRNYRRWVEREEHAPLLRCQGPVISILMPVHNPRREWLEAAVESVRGQTYPHWELCACDDASREAWPAEYWETLARADPRFRFVRSEAHLGIAGATNRAGTLASGEYVALMDQDDLLAPNALAWVAEALEAGPAEMLYSDEDRLDEQGRCVEPIFKPTWSPDLLLSCMYMGHLLTIRRNAADRAGWFRRGLDGSQDYDMVLRVAEQGGTVRHIPRVLYHWRRHGGSTAASAGAKSYTQAAGRRALSEALVRRGIDASIRDGPFPNTYSVLRKASGTKASVVICSRRPRLLRRCLKRLEKTTGYKSREVVVVEHVAGEASMERLLAQFRCVRVPYTGPFDFALMNNLGAWHASGSVLVFLNDDVQPLERGWLEALVAQAERPGVGVVGARLAYPSGAIQHAGLVVGMSYGVVAHPQRDTFGAGYWPWWAVTRNVSAVTGACLAVRKAVFAQLGGFDVSFPINYNDADLCLRARTAGYEVIYEAAAVLRHDECRTRRPGFGFAERSLWLRRWGVPEDPYYSPNLTLEDETAGLRTR